jgi:hypothetical protein
MVGEDVTELKLSIRNLLTWNGAGRRLRLDKCSILRSPHASPNLQFFSGFMKSARIRSLTSWFNKTRAGSSAPSAPGGGSNVICLSEPLWCVIRGVGVPPRLSSVITAIDTDGFNSVVKILQHPTGKISTRRGKLESNLIRWKRPKCRT